MAATPAHNYCTQATFVPQIHRHLHPPVTRSKALRRCRRYHHYHSVQAPLRMPDPHHFRHPRRFRHHCRWGWRSRTPKSKHTCEVGLSESQATSEYDFGPSNCNTETQIENVINIAHVSMNMKVAGSHLEREDAGRVPHQHYRAGNTMRGVVYAVFYYWHVWKSSL